MTVSLPLLGTTVVILTLCLSSIAMIQVKSHPCDGAVLRFEKYDSDVHCLRSDADGLYAEMGTRCASECDALLHAWHIAAGMSIEKPERGGVRHLQTHGDVRSGERSGEQTSGEGAPRRVVRSGATTTVLTAGGERVSRCCCPNSDASYCTPEFLWANECDCRYCVGKNSCHGTNPD